MINPFSIAGPCALPQWLARSVAWTVAGVVAFAPIGWWISLTNNSDTVSQFLCMCGLTLVQVLVWKNAVRGFLPALQQRPTAALGIKILAVLWQVLLLYVLVHCALFTAFAWLLLGDPSPGLQF